MSGLEIALQMLRLAAFASPLIESFLQDAIKAMDGDPRARRIADVLPMMSASRAAEQDLRRMKARQAAADEHARSGNIYATLDAYEREVG